MNTSLLVGDDVCEGSVSLGQITVSGHEIVYAPVVLTNKVYSYPATPFINCKSIFCDRVTTCRIPFFQLIVYDAILKN
jgi:hypothetical protein